jgi:hypothetical protein
LSIVRSLNTNKIGGKEKQQLELAAHKSPLQQFQTFQSAGKASEAVLLVCQSDEHLNHEFLKQTRIIPPMKSQAKPLPIRENSSYLTRSIPLVSPFGPTFGRSISHLPPRSIVVQEIPLAMERC